MEQSDPEKIFNEVLGTAKKDPNILGFFLEGSRGKGRETEHSDYDICIVVKDGKAPAYRKKYPFDKYKDVDFVIYSFSEFARHAQWGSPNAWNRYNFARIRVLIDKNKKYRNWWMKSRAFRRKKSKSLFAEPSMAT